MLSKLFIRVEKVYAGSEDIREGAFREGEMQMRGTRDGIGRETHVRILSNVYSTEASLHACISLWKELVWTPNTDGGLHLGRKDAEEKDREMGLREPSVNCSQRVSFAWKRHRLM